MKAALLLLAASSAWSSTASAQEAAGAPEGVRIPLAASAHGGGWHVPTAPPPDIYLM